MVVAERLVERIVPITDYTFPSLAIEQAILEAEGAKIAPHQCKTEAEVIAAVQGAQVVLAQFAPITRAALAALAPQATVVRYGVGYDNIDIRAARELGVQVAYVPDYCMDEVADHTVALLLALARRLGPLEAELRAGGWRGIQAAGSMPALNQMTVGFIGLGRIGQAVLVRLRPFGCHFVVHDPMLSPNDATQLGVELLGLADLLSQAHAISLHLPLTPATKYLINAERLASMRQGAIIINTARGGLIDPLALAEALAQGQLAGAALDVFEQEPLPSDSPLRSAPRLILTPHMSWYSDTAIGRLQRLAAEEAARALRGERLRCPVTQS